MSHPTDQFTPSGFESGNIEPTLETRDLDAELVSRELSHEFQIVRLLGRGAMGSVYLARDLVLHRVVAIKVLRWDLAGSEDDAERFRREIRLGRAGVCRRLCRHCGVLLLCGSVARDECRNG